MHDRCGLTALDAVIKGHGISSLITLNLQVQNSPVFQSAPVMPINKAVKSNQELSKLDLSEVDLPRHDCGHSVVFWNPGKPGDAVFLLFVRILSSSVQLGQP